MTFGILKTLYIERDRNPAATLENPHGSCFEKGFGQVCVPLESCFESGREKGGSGEEDRCSEEGARQEGCGEEGARQEVKRDPGRCWSAEIPLKKRAISRPDSGL